MLMRHPVIPGRAHAYAPPPGMPAILYADDDFIAVDKPAGLLSVPGKALEHADCVIARVQATYPGARIVHRLDMDTSGVMVLALNADAHRHIGLQFERRHVRKTYRAVAAGTLGADSGHINLPLRCDWPNRPLQMVDHNEGRAAQTDWMVLERREKSALLALYPVTGRSHQLRVHLLALGHPIYGDRFYAPDTVLAAAPRLMLHAHILTLHRPSNGELITIEAALPDGLKMQRQNRA